MRAPKSFAKGARDKSNGPGACTRSLFNVPFMLVFCFVVAHVHILYIPAIVAGWMLRHSSEKSFASLHFSSSSRQLFRDLRSAHFDRDFY